MRVEDDEEALLRVEDDELEPVRVVELLLCDEVAEERDAEVDSDEVFFLTAPLLFTRVVVLVVRDTGVAELPLVVEVVLRVEVFVLREVFANEEVAFELLVVVLVLREVSAEELLADVMFVDVDVLREELLVVADDDVVALREPVLVLRAAVDEEPVPLVEPLVLREALVVVCVASPVLRDALLLADRDAVEVVVAVIAARRTSEALLTARDWLLPAGVYVIPEVREANDPSGCCCW